MNVEHRTFNIEEQIVSRPTMRLSDGIYRLGRILYPDEFDNKTAVLLRRAKGLKIAN
jgi:hypothetical protein